MKKITAAILAVMVWASPVAASAPSPYVGYLLHITEALNEVPELESWTPEQMQEWASGEVRWLMDNPPEECYAAEWGSWMRVVSVIEAWGFMREASVPDFVFYEWADAAVFPSMEEHLSIQRVMVDDQVCLS